MTKAQQETNTTTTASAPPSYPQESIMVADCGSLTTKLTLLDVVDGEFRFVAYASAPGTARAPWNDVSIGVRDAIRQMEADTGRTFLDAEGQLITPERADGSGIDRFLALSSAAEPLDVILAGLVRDVSLASARRAALSTYVDIKDVISLERGPAESAPRTTDAKINAIWHAAPDAVCVVGGTDDGAAAPVLDMVQNILRVALYLMEERAPSVIYAGNARLREAIAQQLGEVTPVRTVDNVRPLPNVENVGPAHEELEVLFYEEKMSALPGINVLRRWSPTLLLPTARAADYTIRYCERSWGTSKIALSVDVGGSSVTINTCRNGQPLTTVRTDLGMGKGLVRLLELVDLDDILRWLPFEIDPGQARDGLLNKALHPRSISQTRTDLLLEQAAAREMLRLALRDSLPGWPEQAPIGGARAFAGWPAGERTPDPMPCIPPCAPLVAGGSVLAQVPYHGHAALIVLDALQPTGINELYLDEYNLLPSLGMVANSNALAAVQILQNRGLTFLGTAVVPVGRARPGDTVLTIRPVGQETSVSSEVTYGNLEAIPFQFFAPGTTLELTPARGFDIGYGPGKRARIEYRGGSVGLIVDARGRPIDLSEDPAARREQADRWLWEMMSA